MREEPKKQETGKQRVTSVIFATMPIVMWSLQSLLAAISHYKVWGWIGLLIYVPSVIFPHEIVQYYANEIAIRYTHKRLYQGSVAGAILIGVVVTLMFLRAVRRQPERRTIGIMWLVTLILIVGTWWTFMANNTELVHFPQYFPEGMVLLALTASPVESIAWATVFGGLDECFQYWVLVQGKPVPYDFNDIFMDQLGGAQSNHDASPFQDALPPPGRALPALRAHERHGKHNSGRIAAGIGLWAAGVMTLYEAANAPPHWFSLSRQKNLPFWFSAPNFLGPRTFHELSPVEGPLLLLLALAAYSLLDRRFRISVPGRNARPKTELAESAIERG